MTLSSAFSPIKHHPVQQFCCHLRQHFSQCWYKVVKFNRMWMLKLLAFSLVIVVFAGITESGRRQYWPCSPRSCQVSPWSHWGHCSHQCGTSGTQTRKRKKTIAESCGGSCLFTLSETHVCSLYRRLARATQTTVRIPELPQAKVALVNQDIEELVVRKVS